MAIYTYSAFNYGHSIDLNNQYINFSENGIDELSATIQVGSYTLGQFIDAVSVAMNKVGTQTYTISLDRSTRQITISAPAPFELWVSSGSQVFVSAYALMGFTGADRTGSNTYTGDSASGSQYRSQFLLQNFTDFEDEQRKAASTVNESASGQVQVTSYGDVKLMTCNITLASDTIPQQAIIENPNGVSDLRDFMIYASNKNSLEFLPDVDNPTSFTNCILEKTPEDAKGTAFKLKELYSRGLTGYFESGNLQFREINF